MAFIQQSLQGSVIQCLELTNSISIGRSSDCDVTLDDPVVSGHHAIIERVDGQVYVRDLASTNGIHINGEKVKEAVLRPEDHLLIGTGEFQLLEQLDDDLAATLRIKKSWIPGVYYTTDKSA